MMKKLYQTLFSFTLLISITLPFAFSVRAQAPRAFSYQGQVLTNGAPSDGLLVMRFSLYSDATGGAAIYSEIHMGVEVKGGLFSVTIGGITPIPEAIDLEEQYYLGVTINDGQELTPRTRLTPAPTAILANEARVARVANALAPGATGVVTSINNSSGALTFEGAGTTTVSADGNKITITSTGGGGATGIQGVQSVNASIAVSDGNGPIANLAINDDAVKTTNLFDAAVTTSKLANESVNSSKLADDAVGPSKLQDASVTTSKLAPDAVTSAKILDGEIVNADLGDSTITASKMNSTPATAGMVLTATSTGGATWQAAPPLSLPFAGTTSTTGTAFDVQTSATAGSAGNFRIASVASTSPVLQVSGTGIGSGIQVQLTNASSGARGIDVLQAGVGPGVFASSAGGNALWGITSSISAAGVIGDNTFGEAVVGRNRGGNGVGAVVGRNDSSGYGVRGFNTKAGTGVLGQAGISGGTGVGGRFENVNASNTNDALQAATNGTGFAASFTNSNSGTSGSVLRASNTNLGRVALLQRGSGTATTTFAALQIENLGASGEGIWLRNGSSTSNNPAIKIHVHPSSTSAILLGTTWNGSGSPTNVVRIDKAGKGFFNGGTQNSGADVAEAFAVVGETSSYEPGDVLVIASGHVRTVTKCSTPYSTAVLGVHATKPGVLLTEREVDQEMTGLIPMGVVGVLPTKVTSEGGAIHAGDLLVTSSTPGHAMRADPSKLSFGMVLGKALEDFDGASGTIQVFVNVK